MCGPNDLNNLCKQSLLQQQNVLFIFNFIKMENSKKSIVALHEEITEWKSNVELVRSEISIFQNELKEIVEKNNHEEILKGVEHFQNQFIRQLEVSDELLHDLHAKDHEYLIKSGSGLDADTILTEDDNNLKDRALTYNKLFSELKTEFRLFLDKWM
jgi:hypothetical protein